MGLLLRIAGTPLYMGSAYVTLQLVVGRRHDVSFCLTCYFLVIFCMYLVYNIIPSIVVYMGRYSCRKITGITVITLPQGLAHSRVKKNVTGGKLPYLPGNFWVNTEITENNLFCGNALPGNSELRCYKSLEITHFLWPPAW